MLLYYIKTVLLQEQSLLLERDKLSAHFAAIMILWENLVDALNNVDHVNANLMISRIDEEKPKLTILTNMAFLLEELSKFIALVIRPLVEDTPLLNTPSHQKKINWHSATISHIKLLKDYLDQLNSHPFKHTQLIENIKDKVNNIYTFWYKYEKYAAAEKYFYFSAYIYFLSQCHFDSTQYGLSLLLAHRSMDLFFQYLAIDNALIIEQTNGMAYKKELGINDRINLMNSEYILMRRGIISSDMERRDFLDWLNTSRNRLLLTHGAYGIMKDEAADALKKSAKIVEKVEGDLRWHKITDEFKIRDFFKYATIYDLEASIDSYCIEKTL